VSQCGVSQVLHSKAAWCLHHLLLLLWWRWRRQLPVGLMPHAEAAVQLANQLVNGSGCASPGSSGGCCCCLASSHGSSAASPVCVLAFSRAAQPLQTCSGWRVGRMVCELMDVLTEVQLSARSGASDVYLLASRGGLLLQLQEAALMLLAVRKHQGAPQGRLGGSGAASSGGRGRGRRSNATAAGSSSSSSTSTSTSTSNLTAIPSCADLAAFLGQVDTAALEHPPLKWDALCGNLVQRSGGLCYALAAMLAPPQPSPPACPRCAPQQLLLLIDTVTTLPHLALQLASSSTPAIDTLDRLLAARADDWQAWLPRLMKQAVPTLSAWVLAAAQQLPMGPAATSVAASSTGSSSRLASSVLHAVRMILLRPGGVLASPQQHQGVPMQQLLACAERALRCIPDASGTLAMPEIMALGVEVAQVGGRRRRNVR
jgi:hypothetical protein